MFIVRSSDKTMTPREKRESKKLSIPYSVYALLTGTLIVPAASAFWAYTRITGQYGDHLKERLGFFPHRATRRLSGSPRIWIHAVSLGEVKVAASLVDALREMIPGCSFMLSTTTPHGRKSARETLGEEVPVVYGPVDFVGSVHKALSTVRPDVMVFLETEIWPSWLFEAHRMGIKTALINGRISPRSIDGYLRLRPFFREVLKNFDAFSMILEEDAARIKAMGAAAEKIEINGNAKYDLLAGAADPAVETEMRRIYNLAAGRSVFVAGSTREGEEEMVLDAYNKLLEKFPETILIIAPRHVERSRDIASLVRRHGHDYQFRTQLDSKQARRTAGVVIIDTFGELFKVYSAATIVFCGASLVPFGGQNPLEPAVWGKVVFYGPSMEDFLDAKALLEANIAGVLVSDAKSMAEKALWFFAHPEDLKAYGQRAREAVLKNQKAAEKHARVIERLLSHRAS